MSRFSRLCLVPVLVAGLLVLVNGQSVYRADGAEVSVQQYQVMPGDNLWKIGIKYGILPEDIAEFNHIDLDDPLQVGEMLAIPDSTTSTYRVSKGDSLWSIAQKQGITINQLLQSNSNINPDKLTIGQVLYLPGKSQIQYSSQTSGTSRFAWPVIGNITSPFGWRKGEFHGGIDIAVNTGTEVHAARAGKVVLDGWNLGFGNTIKIDHGDGYFSIYAHNSKLLVKLGQYVSAGQVIAKSGNTGRSTGPHVHFEVRYKGVAQNPENLLNNYTQVADIQ